MIKVNISEFSKFPGPRFIKLGPNSGELFRNEVLIPALSKDSEVEVNLDGVFGYGSSFLEESFGGLVRAGIETSKIQYIANNLISEDDPSLIEEIQEYINDALEG